MEPSPNQHPSGASQSLCPGCAEPPGTDSTNASLNTHLLLLQFLKNDENLASKTKQDRKPSRGRGYRARREPLVSLVTGTHPAHSALGLFPPRLTKRSAIPKLLFPKQLGKSGSCYLINLFIKQMLYFFQERCSRGGDVTFHLSIQIFVLQQRPSQD